jgi:uncharacterized protein
MGSESLHEPADSLRPETVDAHRAVTSLLEELDAIDWYNQRVDATGDPELAGILAHNRDEEKEHASMLLEWIRRHDARLDTVLQRYLFTAEPILELERTAGEADPPSSGPASAGSLGIGALKDKEAL